MSDLVIFDCDGVLVDSEGPSNAVLVDNLARYGLPLTQADCEALFVGGTMAGVGDKARELGADLPADWIDEIYDLVYARLAQGTPVIPGIAGLLDHLDATGIPFCVASNGSEQKMRITLGQNDLWDRFQGRMFSAHTLGVAKPDPGLFLTPARQFGIAPDRCTVVEDSRTGVTAAMRAGMRCLAYVPHGNGADFTAMGAQVIRHMDEVADLL